MDSGNSSSLQSSSGGGGNGDDEYDSRPDSVLPAFLNTFNPLSSNQHHHQQPTFFDPSTPNYLNPFSQSQPSNNSLLNFDGIRPGMSLRSDPNCTDFGHLQGLNQASFTSSVHDENGGMRSSTQSDHHHQQQQQQQPSGVKNPKKRTRASRRAPTTVMTTDTTNFRAMVQEFTGIPAPPFSGSSYSRRLELFGSGSSRSGFSEPLYPLRPSAKRLHTTTTSLLNNPLLDANAFNPSSSSNYQLPHNMSNQNPILSFQSFLDPPPPLHASLNLPGFGVKPHGASSSAMPSIDELGLSHHGHASVGLNDGNNNNQDHLRPLDGNYDSTNDHNAQRVNGCKLNYSASSSGFHHDKSLENVSSRAEGTVDSWICPTD